MFTHAIVRIPGTDLGAGLTTANLGKPDVAKALQQHQAYVEALARCGLQVEILPATTGHPDATFIEDVALCTPKGAILTRPGALSRQGETQGMEESLSRYFPEIAHIHAPGTLEAGDVLQADNHFFIGISARTNTVGANQLMEILERWGYSASTVPLRHYLHLKTGVSYLGEKHVLVAGELIGHPAFSDFTQLTVDPEEEYAANSLWLNGKVLMPAGFPHTRHTVEAAGYRVEEVAVSEFQKMDGGLSCLSLRF